MGKHLKVFILKSSNRLTVLRTKSARISNMGNIKKEDFQVFFVLIVFSNFAMVVFLKSKFIIHLNINKSFKV